MAQSRVVALVSLMLSVGACQPAGNSTSTRGASSPNTPAPHTVSAGISAASAPAPHAKRTPDDSQGVSLSPSPQSTANPPITATEQTKADVVVIRSTGSIATQIKPGMTITRSPLNLGTQDAVDILVDGHEQHLQGAGQFVPGKSSGKSDALGNYLAQTGNTQPAIGANRREIHPPKNSATAKPASSVSAVIPIKAVVLTHPQPTTQVIIQQAHPITPLKIAPILKATLIKDAISKNPKD